MEVQRAEEFLAELIALVGPTFYGHAGPFEHDGMRIVPIVVIDNDLGQTPNSTIYGLDGYLGFAVNQQLMSLDDTAVKFALAHEIGHLFSATVLARIGRPRASGEVTEVIADLGAAYLLHLGGIHWATIRSTVDDGVRTGIFDHRRSADHPPGKRRAAYVRELITLMHDHSKDFDQAAAKVCAVLRG